MTKNIRQNEFRPEINGLRAISVLAVIANHVSNKTFAHGYIGVDLFFVISGYVITGSLLHRPREPLRKFLIGFYSRRIKRLYPSLLLVTIVTSVLTMFFKSSPMVSLQTGFTSLMGVSNIFLFSQELDYFASSTQMNPFAHTWSLGVEEQFYFVFPIFFWFSQRMNKNQSFLRNIFLIFIAAWSFIKFIQEPSTSVGVHYLVQFRAWEIALGCLIFSVRENKHLQNLDRGVIQNSTLILMVSLLFGGGVEPKFVQVISVILICILLSSQKNSSYFYRILTNRLLVKIGVISYLLYLVHQPILTISKLTIGNKTWMIPIQLLLIYLAANFSHKLIERAVGKSRFFSSAKTIIVSGILSGLTLCIIIFSLWRPLLAEKPPSYYLFLGDHDSVINERAIDFVDQSSGLRAASCHTSDRSSDALSGSFRLTDDFINQCFWQDKKEANIVAFVGDSHTLSLFPVASQLWNETATSIFFLSRDGCAFPSQGKTSRDGCDEVMQDTEEFLVNQMMLNKGPDVIIVTARLLSHFSFGGDHSHQFGNGSNAIAVQENLKLYIKTLSELAVKLKTSADNLIITAPLPEFKGLDTEVCRDQWFRPNAFKDKSCFGSDKSLLLNQRAEIHKQLYSLEQRHSNVFIFDAFDVVCPNVNFCNPSLNGDLIFADSNHLNKAGIKLLKPYFDNFLRENNLAFQE